MLNSLLNLANLWDNIYKLWPTSRGAEPSLFSLLSVSRLSVSSLILALPLAPATLWLSANKDDVLGSSNRPPLVDDWDMEPWCPDKRGDEELAILADWFSTLPVLAIEKLALGCCSGCCGCSWSPNSPCSSSARVVLWPLLAESLAPSRVDRSVEMMTCELPRDIPTESRRKDSLIRYKTNVWRSNKKIGI